MQSIFQGLFMGYNVEYLEKHLLYHLNIRQVISSITMFYVFLFTLSIRSWYFSSYGLFYTNKSHQCQNDGLIILIKDLVFQILNIQISTWIIKNFRQFGYILSFSSLLYIKIKHYFHIISFSKVAIVNILIPPTVCTLQLST